MNAAALLVLMLIGGLALIGPSGLLSWGEQASRLDEHEVRIAALHERKAELENRVTLLDPNNVDPFYPNGYCIKCSVASGTLARL